MPLDLVPEVSVLDQCIVEEHDWDGAPAWKAEVKLDPTAHAGLADTSQLIEIVPMESGRLVLMFPGDDAAFQKNDDVISQVMAHVHFNFGQE